MLLELESGVLIGVESKFTEWLTPKRRNRAPFKPKYFAGGAELWTRNGLPKCQSFAADLAAGVEHCQYLDAAQLLKHALGLAVRSPGRFALLYLFYDAPCPAARAHRAELARFTERVGDELAFKALSYQDVFERLCENQRADSKYLAYLGHRYFGRRAAHSAP